MFEADEMRLIIDALSGNVEISVEKYDKKTNRTEEVKQKIKENPILRAMTVLSLNTAFGQTDVSNLPIKSVDFDSGWIDFSRVKTKIPRRIPLWPETVQLLREALELRPTPIDPDDAGLLFLTRRGDRWVRDSRGEKQAWKC